MYVGAQWISSVSWCDGVSVVTLNAKSPSSSSYFSASLPYLVITMIRHYFQHTHKHTHKHERKSAQLISRNMPLLALVRKYNSVLTAQTSSAFCCCLTKAISLALCVCVCDGLELSPKENWRRREIGRCSWLPVRVDMTFAKTTKHIALSSVIVCAYYNTHRTPTSSTRAHTHTHKAALKLEVY